jgi:hypothetical protein
MTHSSVAAKFSSVFLRYAVWFMKIRAAIVSVQCFLSKPSSL